LTSTKGRLQRRRPEDAVALRHEKPGKGAALKDLVRECLSRSCRPTTLMSVGSHPLPPRSSDDLSLTTTSDDLSLTTTLPTPLYASRLDHLDIFPDDSGSVARGQHDRAASRHRQRVFAAEATATRPSTAPSRRWWSTVRDSTRAWNSANSAPRQDLALNSNSSLKVVIRPQRAADLRPFVVELPGIEPDALPGNMPSELLFRYVSVRYSPARYLRFRSRVLTASRAVNYPINLLSASHRLERGGVS
jgi:hypothetical protein